MALRELEEGPGGGSPGAGEGGWTSSIQGEGSGCSSLPAPGTTPRCYWWGLDGRTGGPPSWRDCSGAVWWRPDGIPPGSWPWEFPGPRGGGQPLPLRERWGPLRWDRLAVGGDRGPPEKWTSVGLLHGWGLGGFRALFSSPRAGARPGIRGRAAFHGHPPPGATPPWLIFRPWGGKGGFGEMIPRGVPSLERLNRGTAIPEGGGNGGPFRTPRGYQGGSPHQAQCSPGGRPNVEICCPGHSEMLRDEGGDLRPGGGIPPPGPPGPSPPQVEG